MVVETAPSILLDLTASLLQLALPAVEESFLLQMILIPPVDCAIAPTWPSPIARSTSATNKAASCAFCSSNAFRRSVSFLSLLAGLLLELLRADFEGDNSSLSSSTECKRVLRGDFKAFLGEYCSFQSLITFALQKASMLGRCGEGGIR